MIQTAEQFSRKEVLSCAERLEKQEENLMPTLIRKAGQLGFCGLDTPETYGGLGLSKTLAARILEMLSLDASFSVTLGVTSGVAQLGLILFGKEEQKKKYLPFLASGEWIGAYALSEPNSGSDALSMTTRAEAKNDRFILNGTKMWISNAKWADLFVVFAKIDGQHVSAFLIERHTPGLTIEREEHKMGLKGSSTTRLLLENVEVPKENLLYEPGKGHHVAFNVLNLGRFKLGAMSLGPAREAIYQATGYATERKQFGKPIAAFGLIQKKFAEMAARYFAAEAMIYRTGASIDEAFKYAGSEPKSQRKAAEEYAIECSACKIFATETEAFIVDEALQVFGGYGFSEEFPLARIYRDCRVSRIYEGTNEINRLFITNRLFRRIREGRLPSKINVDSFVSELTSQALSCNMEHQIHIGALADLILLTYAEQSARLRAQQTGELGQALYRVLQKWIYPQAATAYQTITGKSTTLPPPPTVDESEIAKQLYLSRSPFLGM